MAECASAAQFNFAIECCARKGRTTVTAERMSLRDYPLLESVICFNEHQCKGTEIEAGKANPSRKLLWRIINSYGERHDPGSNDKPLRSLCDAPIFADNGSLQIVRTVTLCRPECRTPGFPCVCYGEKSRRKITNDTTPPGRRSPVVQTK